MRTARECIESLRSGGWALVSLDHDLDDLDGDIEVTGTGMDVLEWISQQVEADPAYVPPRIQIHHLPRRPRRGDGCGRDLG